MAAAMTLALIAGGGTGGHLSIATAIAQAMADAVPGERVVLLGCKASTDEPVLKESGFPFCIIPARAWPGGPSWSQLPGWVWEAALGVGSTFWAVGRALRLLRRERPKVLVGVGGYGSVPAGLAAWLMRIPILIHEADSVPGVANRFLARLAKSITLGYREATGTWCAQKAKVTGNPVRRAFHAVRRPTARESLGIDSGGRLILVLGGSQGARSINQTVLGTADDLLKEEHVCLLHISGWRDYHLLEEQMEKIAESVRPRYWLRPFLGEEQMATALAAADVVITRAGASALAEVATMGTPAVIVPYPFARGGHQAGNARYLVEKRQGVLLRDEELDVEALGRAVERASLESGTTGERRPENGATEIAGLAVGLAKGRFASTKANG